MRRWPRLVLALLVPLLVAGWAPAPQEGGLRVVGLVTNGTPGESVPAGLAVTLHVFSGTEERATYTTRTASDGSFSLEGLTSDGALGEVFVARVVFQDVTYLSEFVAPEPDQSEVRLPVTVYGTSEDAGDIEVAQLHIFLVPMDGRLQVREYYLVSNTGDRTYVGARHLEIGRRTTLTFTLPEEAEGLAFEGAGLGERFFEQGGGFVDTAPVLPGSASGEVLFSYEMPYREGARIERVLDVPISSAVLVLADSKGFPKPLESEAASITLLGDGISPAGVLDTQMGEALSYTAGPLAAGEPLAFTLVAGSQPGAVVPGETASVRNATLETAIGLAALAAAVLVVYLLLGRQTPRFSAMPIPAQARPLVEAMAKLDGDFEAGQVAEEAYRRERASLRRQVRAALGSEGHDRGP